MSRATVVITLALANACALPATDLSGASGDPASMPPPGSAAAVASLMDPMAGAVDVPSNLAAVIVRFTGPIAWGSAGIQVWTARTALAPALSRVPSRPRPPSRSLARAAAATGQILGGLLPAGVTCQVAIGDGIMDAAGKPIAAGVIGVFDTAAARDQAPPVLSGVIVDVAGPCLTVSFATDEPSTGSVAVRAGDVELETQAGVGATAFSVSIPMTDLPAKPPRRSPSASSIAPATSPHRRRVPFQTPVACRRSPSPRCWPTPPDRARSGVRRAAEPGRREPFRLAGLRLEDAKGADELPADDARAGRLCAGRALGLRSRQGQDAPPRGQGPCCCASTHGWARTGLRTAASWSAACRATGGRLELRRLGRRVGEQLGG